MVLQIRDAASGCPRGQIEAGLVSLQVHLRKLEYGEKVHFFL